MSTDCIIGDVIRIGAHGALSVHQMDSESAPGPGITKTSPGTSQVLDINRNTVIHVGGLGVDTQVTCITYSRYTSHHQSKIPYFVMLKNKAMINNIKSQV